jgi:hypothetical protein
MWENQVWTTYMPNCNAIALFLTGF